MKAALFKPRLYFEHGYWRVDVPGRPAHSQWKHLREADQRRIEDAHTHAAKLNASPEALALRTLYYKGRGFVKASGAQRISGPEYKARVMASFLANRLR